MYKNYEDHLAYTKEYSRKKYYQAGGKEKKAKEQKQRISNRRQFIYEQKGACCSNCGSTERLEFDHINPNLKTSRVSFASMARKDLIQELDNCQVLCHECHTTRTHAQRQAAWYLYCQLTPEQQAELEHLFAYESLQINNSP